MENVSSLISFVTADDSWDKGQGERLLEFMRNIRGEFAAHLRHLYTTVSTVSSSSASTSSDPSSGAPDEL